MTALLTSVIHAINDSHTKLYTMAAIYPDKTKGVREVMVVETNRIAPPDQIKVISGYMVSVDEIPSHEIVKLSGLLNDTYFQIEAKNLETGENEIVKLLP